MVLLTAKPSRDSLSPASTLAVTCLFSISPKWVNLMTGRCCGLCPPFLRCPFPPSPSAPPPPHCSLHYIICCSQQVYSGPNVSQLSPHSCWSLFPAAARCGKDFGRSGHHQSAVNHSEKLLLMRSSKHRITEIWHCEGCLLSAGCDIVSSCVSVHGCFPVMALLVVSRGSHRGWTLQMGLTKTAARDAAAAVPSRM